MCVSAALRGTGLFQMPLPQAMRYVESGELVTVLDDFGVETAGLSLYYPGHSQSLPKLRAFVDFARDRMRRAFEAADYLP
jgi:DNA-binding transcriptional LysR family regulator